MNVHNTYMKIYIDCRESRLITISLTNDFVFVQKNLDIGDVLITDEQDAVLCIIERKTTQDMISSIKDGRYKEQHNRLVNNFDKKHILYIIENYNSFSTLMDKRLESAILHSIFRDDIKFMFSKNVEDTFYIIKSIVERIERNPSYFLPNKNNLVSDETSCYFNKHTIKKTINSTESVNTNMFCQIPGVSLKTAVGLIDSFATIHNMICTLNKLNSQDEQLNMLLNIKINSRKLNKRIAQNIIDFLL